MHQRYLLALALALATLIPARAEAQEITDENYLRYGCLGPLPAMG